jgi:hypothetical protein
VVDALLVVVVGLVVGALGVGIGMLAAPRIDRWLQRRENDDIRRDRD